MVEFDPKQGSTCHVNRRLPHPRTRSDSPGLCPQAPGPVQVSDHFQAILACLLGEDWTTPRLVEMVMTPDAHLLGRCDGEATFKVFLGASEDLIKNIHGIASVAELDGDEIGYLVAKVVAIKSQK